MIASVSIGSRRCHSKLAFISLHGFTIRHFPPCPCSWIPLYHRREQRNKRTAWAVYSNDTKARGRRSGRINSNSMSFWRTSKYAFSALELFAKNTRVPHFEKKFFFIEANAFSLDGQASARRLTGEHTDRGIRAASVESALEYV